MYHKTPPPPPSYEDAMAEKQREEDVSRTTVTFSEYSPAQEYSTIIKVDLEAAAAEKMDTTVWERRTRKEDIELTTFNGKLSKRAVNRKDACVISVMAASILGLPLIPFYCGWCCLNRAKWDLHLTNKGLHYRGWRKCYLHKSFIPLLDIRHICLESEHGSVVVVTTTRGRVRVEWVDNAADLVRAVRRVKGWPQLRILTE